MPRLAVLRFSHEGNSFNPIPTGREAFEKCEWLKGEPAFDAAAFLTQGASHFYFIAYP